MTASFGRPDAPVGQSIATDAELAAATAGLLSASTAASTYARPRANTISFLGDSFTAMCADTSGVETYYASRGFANWALVRLRQRLRRVSRTGTLNGGVTGQTIAQVAARVDADVIDLDPGWVHILAGTNDIAAGTSLATMQSGMTSIFDAVHDAGIRPIIGTIAPYSDTPTSAQLKMTDAYNAWLRDQARSIPGAVLVDYHHAVAGGDGDWRFPASLKITADEIHPSTGGALRMGKALADALEPLVPAVQILPTSNYDYISGTADPLNLLTNPTQTGTGTISAGHTAVTGGGTGSPWGLGNYADGGPVDLGSVTASVVTRDDAPGQWQQFTCDEAGSGQVRWQQTISSGYTSGDVIQGAVEFELESVTHVNLLRLTVVAYDAGAGYASRVIASSADYIADDYAVDVLPVEYFPTSGVMLTPPVTVPATTITGISFCVDCGVEGTVRVGSAQLRRSR